MNTRTITAAPVAAVIRSRAVRRADWRRGWRAWVASGHRAWLQNDDERAGREASRRAHEAMKRAGVRG